MSTRKMFPRLGTVAAVLLSLATMASPALAEQASRSGFTDTVDVDVLGARHEGAHELPIIGGVAAEYREWVVRFAILQHREWIGQLSGHTASRLL